MNDCTSLATEIADAFQQIFNIGGWNSVLWVCVGFTLSGAPLRAIERLMDRKSA